MFHTKITKCAHFLPKKILTNDDLSKVVDTCHEWIFSRTGIKQRHIAEPDEKCVDLAYQASIQIIDDPLDIDLIIVATCTAEQRMPSTACLLQDKLGAKNAICFDMQAACAGFVYAITVADQFIKTGKSKKALILGSETMSKILDWSDRNTCVLFGDGAGACILERSTDEARIIDSCIHSDGTKKHLGHVDQHLKMRGQELFKYAIDRLGKNIEEILEKNNVKITDLAWIIPHQANLRIIETLAKHFNIPLEKFIISIDTAANTSAASIPIALSYAVQEGKIKKGDLILLSGIGFGLVWGSILLRW